VVLLTALAALAAPAAAQAAKDDLDLVSRLGVAGAVANGNAFDAAIAADGRHVAFATSATNLGGDPTASSDILVKDLVSGTLVPASLTDADMPTDGNSMYASISGDGRYVAFQSDANNLSGDDVDTVTNVYVRDMVAGTTEFVSRAGSSASDGGTAGSRYPSISRDGRWVAFESDANNLSTDDSDVVINVYLRDTLNDTTELVSRAGSTPNDGGNGFSESPDVSGDGRYVAFESKASNLVSGTDNGVYVRDTQTDATTLASRAGNGDPNDGIAIDPSISADGRFVAFDAHSTNLHPDATGAYEEIYVRDRTLGTTELVSRASASAGGAPADAESSEPSVSDDGRYVSFESNGDNLGQTDGARILLRDVHAQVTHIADRAAGPDGEESNGETYLPTVSGDGRYVVFDSYATNLHLDDGDGTRDVFRRDVLGDPPPAPGTLPGGAVPGGGSAAGGAAGAAGIVRVDSFSILRTVFAVARASTPTVATARGTAFRYVLSAPARVAIVIERREHGRRAGRRCRRATRRLRTRRRCTRFVRAGTLVRRARPAGRNQTPFSGRIGRRALRVGRYRATLTAIDGAGKRSTPRRVFFRIARR
jgi:Tol biopolymer transport system component